MRGRGPELFTMMDQDVCVPRFALEIHSACGVFPASMGWMQGLVIHAASAQPVATQNLL